MKKTKKSEERKSDEEEEMLGVSPMPTAITKTSKFAMMNKGFSAQESTENEYLRKIKFGEKYK